MQSSGVEDPRGRCSERPAAGFGMPRAAPSSQAARPRSRSPCPASCSHCPCAFRVWQLTAESEGSRIGRDVKSEGEPFLKDCSDGSLCMWITENYSRWTGDGRLRLLSFSLLIGGVLNPTTASTLRGMPARALRGRNQCTGVKH